MERVVLLFVAMLICTPCVAEPDRPFVREANKYLNMLFDRKYAELEELARDYLTNKKTISDGQPALAALYAGVSGCVSSGCMNHLSEMGWKKRLERIEEWVELYPESITAKVARASYYMEYAWSVRGSGYARTVTDERWRIFYDNIQISSDMLMEIEEDGKRDPGWYDAMLLVGLSQSWTRERMDAVYEEGITSFPFYLPLYFGKSAYHSPRWYGSASELRTYVEEAVDVTREEMGETLYARLNWSLRTNDMFNNGQAEWSRMKAGFERMTKDYPDPWNINNYAKFACLAQDWVAVTVLAERIGETPLLGAWSGSKVNYDRCVSYANTMMERSQRNQL